MRASHPWFNPELAFVAKASVGSVDAATAADVTDWRAVVDLAIEHRVFPRVMHFGAKHIPVQRAEQLRERIVRNSRAALANVARTIEVVDLLSHNKLDALVLKGPFLSYDLFQDYGMRVSGDVDVLVPEHQLTRAARILADAGYAHHAAITDASLHRHRRTEHDVAFAHPEDHTLIEIHADIAQPHYSFNVDVWTWWQSSRTHHVAGKEVRTPSLENAYLIAVLHAARHRWSRLDLIADVAAFQSISFDRSRVQSCAARSGVLRIVHVAESMTALIGSHTGDSPGSRLATSLMKKLAQGSDFSRWEGFWLDIGVRERARDRLRYALGRGLRRHLQALH